MNAGKQHIDTVLLAKYFSGETSPEEIRRIEVWIARSEANCREFDELKQTWDLMDKTGHSQKINIDEEWTYHLNKIHSYKVGKKNIFSLKRIIQVAAAVIFLFSISLVARHFLLHKFVNTRLAETTEISLPDGSKVTLNAHSKIIYSKNFALNNRMVRLTGEAYFEVRKDTALAFIITMNDAKIEVLGTLFNVKAYKKSDKIEVTVTEGKVSLYEKDLRKKQVIATRGERAVYDRNQKVVKKTINADQNYMAWKTRKLVFDNDNLSKVAETIGEVYHRKIVLANDGLDSCTLTTRFEEKDLNTVLKVLESTLDITIEQKNDIIYLSGEGCN